jgi:hypothetical protein
MPAPCFVRPRRDKGGHPFAPLARGILFAAEVAPERVFGLCFVA